METDASFEKAQLIEHVKILQLKKLLTFCKFKRHDKNKLFAETLLLESVEKLKLINKNISDGSDSFEEITETHFNPTVSISNIKLQIKPNAKIRKDDYFVILLMNGLDIRASQPVKVANSMLAFEENFEFSSGMYITVKLYCITLTQARNPKRFVFVKATKYDILLPSEDYRSNELLYPNMFSLLGEFSINLSERNSKCINIPHKTQVTSNAIFTVNIHNNEDKISDLQRLGFLTVGERDKNGCITWDRKWCCLLSSQLKVYNFPSDEFFRQPVLIVDLKKCNKQDIKEANSCARSRTLLILINNKEFFLRADNNQDLRRWQHDLNLVISTCSL